MIFWASSQNLLPIGSSWAHHAEVNAILQALLFCKEFNFKRVQIDCDSTLAVGWIQSKKNRPWALLNDLNRIDLLKTEGEADFLAKSGVLNSPVV